MTVRATLGDVIARASDPCIRRSGDFWKPSIRRPADDDSLAEIDVPEATGAFVALDSFTQVERSDVLLDVFAGALRWWLRLGRIFGVIARTDHAAYEPSRIGATRSQWNRREGLRTSRG